MWQVPGKGKVHNGVSHQLTSNDLRQIFEAERKASRTLFWHKKCFSCRKCHKALDSALQYTHEGPDREIYCKDCFRKSFPESEVPLLYQDTTKIKPEDEENGCPRCGGAVYKESLTLYCPRHCTLIMWHAAPFQAEEVNIKERVYHKKCLTCKSCKRPCDISGLAIGPEGDIYCNICCHKVPSPSPSD